MTLIPDAISVVIPTYNRAHIIEESIQSVLDQTLQPLEIIVVDDFSTDNTEVVVNSLNSPLIKYVKNKRKKGANGARNTGILMAQGEYIAFHDSDDIWYPKKLELQYHSFRLNKDLDICFCSLIQDDTAQKIIPNQKVLDEEISDKLLYGNFISTQTIMVKIKGKRFLFDEDLKRFQDWDFVLSLRGCKFTHLDKVLVNQRMGEVRISKINNDVESFNAVFKKYPHIVANTNYFRIMYLKGKINNSFKGDNMLLVYKLKLYLYIALGHLNKFRNILRSEK
ncbi:glycosyltransferase family 2 protein [Acinetobacter johnsonii]|nr:glycosyltransferase family 2 protein [Acinetobacter johnsonii]